MIIGNLKNFDTIIGNQKNSAHLYRLPVARMEFPSLVMVIVDQNNFFAVDKDYRKTK